MGTFGRRREGRPPAGRGSPAGRMVVFGLRAVWRLGVSLAALGVISCTVLYLLLLRGPISLPGMAGVIEERLTAALGGAARAEIGDVVLALREGGAPTGIQLRDLRLTTPEGTRLLAVPRVIGRFALDDLVAGRVRPIAIILAGPEAELVREPDGSFRFGLGPVDAGGDTGDTGGTAQLTRLLDGLAGGAPLPDALSRLARIRIVDARLTYRDRMGGSVVTGEGAELELVREAGGARLRIAATLRSPGALPGSGGADVLIEGRRRAGDDASEVSLTVANAHPAALARQFPALEWLALIDAPLRGALTLTLADDGTLRALGGSIAAGAGQVTPGTGAALPIRSLALDFRLDAPRERLLISRAALSAKALEAEVTGFLDLERGAGGGLRAVVGQFDVARLDLDLPEIFDRRLAFDAGRISARLVPEPFAIEIGEARLVRGGLTIEVSGRSRAADAGWQTDLRVLAREVPAAELVALWPLIAAGNPRRWIDERVEGGIIGELLAQVRLGRGEPQVALDFAFRDTTARYVPTMPPIAGASGRGHLAGLRFALAIDEGTVTPEGGAPIRLGGSTFAIPDVVTDDTIGEVALEAEGGLGDVLRLIDTPPLGLVGRLGADLGEASGQARVSAALRFPLLSDLAVEDVTAAVTADFEDLRLSPVLGAAGRLAIAAPSVRLVADDTAMRVTGRASVGGLDLAVDWTERFSGGGGREIALQGTLPQARLAELVPGAGDVVREGRLPLRLTLRQSGGGATGFDLTADLGPAGLALPALGWAKAPGTDGRLTAAGTLGERLEIDRFRLAAGDLEAEGAARLLPGGGLDRVTIARLVLGSRADLGLDIWRDAQGTLRARATGQRLDLTEFLAESGGDDDGDAGGGDLGGGAFRAELALDRLDLSENLSLTAVTGEYLRTAGGEAQARITGRIGGAAWAVIDYAGAAGGDERVTVTSDDAGAFLAGGGYFEGGSGGSMVLEALIAPMAGVEAQGLLTIRDMRVAQAPTLSGILRSGDAAELSSEVDAGGLRFREIVVPFVYGGGQVRLTDAIATSPSLAIKAEGTYDEGADAVDLRGVISPAYAVTGVLDRIPLLGTILSGGEGEGIFAMTFTVAGSAADPDFDVQPLSLLAPGILRRVFTGTGGNGLPAEEFERRIRQPGR